MCRTALLLLLAATAAAQTIEGNWLGTLEVPNGKLRLAWKVQANAAGGYNASVDSIDQGAHGLPVDEVIFEPPQVRFTMKRLGASYAGQVDEGGRRIRGEWTQGGTSLPLDFERSEGEPPRLHRPQDPKPPFPYVAEDVTYESGGVTLAGTLTRPNGDGPFPALLLLSGSGPQDRDEQIFGHRPFAVIADHLSRRGCAILRVDDRGVGKSTGRLADATMDDLAADALAGIRFLRARKEIDPKRLGILGHSEGAVVGPLAATKSGEVRLLVLLAPPAVPGKEILYAQGEAIARASGVPPEGIERNRVMQTRIVETIIGASGADEARRELEAVIAEVPEAQRASARAQIASFTSPNLKSFLAVDPQALLRKLRVPLLALFGEKDLQVLPSQNAGPLEAALKAAGNSDYQVRILPGLNHLFQPAKTGAPSEYAKIDETFSPAALDAIAEWLKDH
jgi:uncharacterized protein